MQTKIRNLLLIGTASLTLAGFTGCSMYNDKKGKETGRSGDEYAYDRGTTDRVEDGLKNATVYKFPSVKVYTFQGVVQLSGFTETDAQKQDAGEIARTTVGVSKVVNNIMVQSPTPTGRTAAPNSDAPQPPAQPHQ